MPILNTLASCNNTNDGSIIIQNQSGSNCLVQLQRNNQIVANAQFTSLTHSFNNLLPGIYTIIYPETQICGVMTQEVEVKAAKTVIATIQVTATTVAINQPVVFRAPKSKGVVHYWTFGDGIAQQGELVTHQYAYEGLYNATLTSVKGNCEDIKAVDITVKNTLSTNRDYAEVKTIDGSYYAVFNAEQIINATIKVHNALGQVIGNVLTFEGKNGNVLIELNDSPEGVYIVSITSGNSITTQKIIR